MKLTKAQVDKQFLEEVMPYIRMQEKEYRTGRHTKDISWRCTEYNDFIDYMKRENLITEHQARNYSIPKHLI